MEHLNLNPDYPALPIDDFRLVRAIRSALVFKPYYLSKHLFSYEVFWTEGEYPELLQIGAMPLNFRRAYYPDYDFWVSSNAVNSAIIVILDGMITVTDYIGYTVLAAELAVQIAIGTGIGAPVVIALAPEFALLLAFGAYSASIGVVANIAKAGVQIEKDRIYLLITHADEFLALLVIFDGVSTYDANLATSSQGIYEALLLAATAPGLDGSGSDPMQRVNAMANGPGGHPRAALWLGLRMAYNLFLWGVLNEMDDCFDGVESTGGIDVEG